MTSFVSYCLTRVSSQRSPLESDERICEMAVEMDEMTRRILSDPHVKLVAGLIALITLLLGCLPIPNVRLDLDLPAPEYRLPPERVRTRYLSLPGYPEPHTPDEYNRALYRRYYAPGDSADTIFVMMPGLYGGAGSFDLLARQLVSIIPGAEVWAVDRRANLLEDRAAAVESLRQRDPMIAYEHYVEKQGTPEGFTPLEPDEVRFMGHWGLEVHLHDLHEIVKEAAEQAPRVVLAGHSLGASIVSLYAAYAFEDDGRRRPGYDWLEGLMLLDGGLGRTGGFDREELTLGPIRVLPTVEDLKEERGRPFMTLTRNPRSLAEIEAATILARFDPEGLSPGGFLDYPVTNRAVTGIYGNARYGNTPIFGISLGEAVGADFSGNLTAVLLSGSMAVTSKSVRGLADGYDYVSWERGDPRESHTDIDALSEAWVQEDTNFTEWYTPTRLILDMSRLGVRLRDEPNFVPNSEVPLPTLAIGAKRGLMTSLDDFSAYINARPGASISSYILSGLTHIDIVTAETNSVAGLTEAWLSRLP